MEFRALGRSGLKVPVLSFGTGTFGGANEFFQRWGSTDVKQASRLVDVCLEAGVNFFDTADIYSQGASEEILGRALAGRRAQVLISTKATFRTGPGPNDLGSSRAYLVRAGKVRYTGCSNFTGWQAMKSLALAERYGWARYAAYQGYYSLVGRDYEDELMPLGLDQGLALMVWSPLGWGRLSGKIRRGRPLPEGRIKSGGAVGGPQVDEDYLYKVVDALDAVAAETGKSVPQIALNWLLGRPTVANVIIGARDEAQLRDNLGALGWKLTEAQRAQLDAASRRAPPYPYWHHRGYPELVPPAVPQDRGSPAS